jgi:hypothetical protein
MAIDERRYPADVVARTAPAHAPTTEAVRQI